MLSAALRSQVGADPHAPQKAPARCLTQAGVICSSEGMLTVTFSGRAMIDCYLDFKSLVTECLPKSISGRGKAGSQGCWSVLTFGRQTLVTCPFYNRLTERMTPLPQRRLNSSLLTVLQARSL